MASITQQKSKSLPATVCPPLKKPKLELGAGSNDTLAKSDSDNLETDKADQPQGNEHTNMMFSLLGSVPGLNAPLSLLERSAHTWASVFNADTSAVDPNLIMQTAVPPSLKWCTRLESAVCSKLSAPALAKYLACCGGLVEMQKRLTSEDLQPVIKRIFQVARYSPADVFCKTRLELMNEITVYLENTMNLPYMDHTLLRLGMKTEKLFTKSRECFFADAKYEQKLVKTSKDTGKDNASYYIFLFYENNRNPEDHFYINCQQPDQSEHHDVKAAMQRWTYREKSNRLVLSAKFEKERTCTLSCHTCVNLPPVAHCRRLLAAAGLADTYHRHYSVAYLCVQLLIDPTFQNDPVLTPFLVYVWSMLASNLSALNCRIDLALEFLERANRYTVYPSDKIVVLLARQKVLAHYGFFDLEEKLFEHLCKSDLMLKGSTLLIDALNTHLHAVWQQNSSALIELFILVRMRDRGKQLGIEGILIPEAFSSALEGLAKSIVNRSESLFEFAQYCKGCIPRGSKFKKEMKVVWNDCGFQRAVFLNVIAVFQNNNMLAESYSNEYWDGADLQDMAWLLHLASSNDKKGQYFDMFVNEQAKCLQLFAERNGAHNHVREGDNCFAKMGYILASGIIAYNASTWLMLKDLYSKTVCAYDTISVHVPHYSKRLLEKLNCVINDQPLTTDLLEGNQTGLAQIQARANWASCKNLPQPNSEHLTDYELLSFYMDHDSGYLKEVLTFGRDSVHHVGST